MKKIIYHFNASEKLCVYYTIAEQVPFFTSKFVDEGATIDSIEDYVPDVIPKQKPAPSPLFKKSDLHDEPSFYSGKYSARPPSSTYSFITMNTADTSFSEVACSIDSTIDGDITIDPDSKIDSPLKRLKSAVWGDRKSNKYIKPIRNVSYDDEGFDTHIEQKSHYMHGNAQEDERWEFMARIREMKESS